MINKLIKVFCQNEIVLQYYIILYSPSIDYITQYIHKSKDKRHII